MSREFTIFGAPVFPFTPVANPVVGPATVESWPHLFQREEDGTLIRVASTILEGNRILISSVFDLRTFRAVQKILWENHRVCVGPVGKRGGGKGPKVCPVCGRRFTSDLGRATHIRHQHLIEPTLAKPCDDRDFEIAARKAGEPAKV